MHHNCDKLPELWPGPMEGVGSPEFFRAVSALRLTERWMTPFFRISGQIPGHGKLRKFIAPFLGSGLPVTLQLMGTDPLLIGKAANIFLSLGAADVNINFGCPSARVTASGAGGGALKHPEALPEFCSIARNCLDNGKKFSIKIRSGWDNWKDMERFLPGIAASGAVNKIFFHYRTVKELYSPDVLPERVLRLSRAVELCPDTPVIANGDLDSVDTTLKVLNASGCSGAMIARPWMRDPFLLRRFHGDNTDRERGREIFFTQLQKEGISGGALLEMVRMLWGVNSPQFQSMIKR